jgi:hypothetical protein
LAFLRLFLVASASLILRWLLAQVSELSDTHRRYKMASVVAGVYTLAMLAIFTFAFMSIFGDMITYDAVVMATDVFGDVFTYDAVVMALVSGLAYGLLLSHSTTKASSFIRFSLILLIVAAVPVVAMPGGANQRDALAAGGAAALILGGQLAGAVGKRRAASVAPKNGKKSRKAKKAKGNHTTKASLPAALKPKSAHASRDSAAEKARDSAAEHGNATAPGKEFMAFVNKDGLQCDGSEAGHLVTSHVDLFGRIHGFLEETTTAASEHPKVKAAKEKFRAEGTGKMKSWQQVNQRFALFERYMMVNNFSYGTWILSLGIRGCDSMDLDDHAFKVSDVFFTRMYLF